MMRRLLLSTSLARAKRRRSAVLLAALLAAGGVLTAPALAQQQQPSTAICAGVTVRTWVTALRPTGPLDQTVGYNLIAGYCEIYTAASNSWAPLLTGTAIVGTVLGAVKVKTGAYTVAASDCGTTIVDTSNSPVALTVGSAVVPQVGQGCTIAVVQGGTAKISITLSGVTLVSAFTGTSGTQGAIVDLELTTVAGVATAYLVGTGS